jgi:hypothetical protein
VYAQVRDYSFSPDTGRIETIRYDPLGQPLVPESIMTVWEVRVEHVLTVNPRFLVLQPGAQEMAVLIHDGFIGQLYRGVQVSPSAVVWHSGLILDGVLELLDDSTHRLVGLEFHARSFGC